MAGTINLANVALGFDASKITRGVDLTAGEMRKLNGIFQGSISNVDKYNMEMGILDKARKTGALTADRLVQSEEALARKYGLLTNAIKEVNIVKRQENELDRLKATSAVGIGNGMVGLIGRYSGLAAAGLAVKESLSLAATAESNKISLEVMTGSAEKAKMLFDGFIELDRNSPLSRSDFSRASQTLVGYGLAAESTIPTLRRLSEISGGNADRFQSLSLAYGQVTANGRLMGQEVLQMVNAGFNPLQEISRKTGRSMIELKKAMEDGSISSRMVEDALQSATSEGGRFHDMNERLKNSTAGQWSKMKSDVELLATEIGTNLLPVAKDFMNLMSSGGANLQSAAGGLASFASDGIRALMAVGKDAYTNLDGNSRGTAVSSLADEIQYRDMERKMLSEYVHVKTPEERARVESNMARRDAAKNARETAIAKRQTELEEQKKLEQQMLTSSRNSFQSEVKKIQETYQRKKMGEEQYGELQLRNAMKYEQMNAQERKMLDDALKMRKEMSDMDKTEHNQKVRDDFAKEKNKIVGDLKEREAKILSDGKNGVGVSQTIAPALKAGSVEAYKFMLQQKDKVAEIAERQAASLDEANELARKHISIAENQAVLRLKR